MKWISLISFWCICCNPLIAADYADQFEKLKSTKTPAEVERLLEEWRQQKPADPEAWVSSANYALDRATSIVISTKPPGKDDAIVMDSKNGKVKGSLSHTRDEKLIQTGISYLREAAAQFPERLDIWCGLIYTLQQSGDFDGQFEAIKSCVAHAKGHPAELLWLKGSPLPAPAATFVPEKLHAYIYHYMETRTATDDERFFKLASFVADSYPKHAYAFNDLAAYYNKRGDQPKVRGHLKKAHQADPNDVIVLLNLGDAYAQAHDSKRARACYEKVIDLKPGSGELAAAKEGLQQLENRPK